MPRQIKSDLFSILGDKAFAFASYCAEGGSAQSRAIAWMFENIDGINLSSPVFIQGIIPILEAAGVVDQGVKDRINASVGEVVVT